jgi:hypothetical protein
LKEVEAVVVNSKLLLRRVVLLQVVEDFNINWKRLLMLLVINVFKAALHK